MAIALYNKTEKNLIRPVFDLFIVFQGITVFVFLSLSSFP